MPTITVRGHDRQSARAMAYRVAAALAGRGDLGAVREVQTQVGKAALVLIRERFDVLSANGSYMGERWAPLAPATIARKLANAGLPTRRGAARLVTDAALKLQRTRKGSKSREKALTAYGRAKATAARSFGEVPIGIETGEMKAALTADRSANGQVLDVSPGSVTVGCDLDKAGRFHKGTRRQPSRRLWPERLPDAWLGKLASTTGTGFLRVLAGLLGSPVA